MMTLPNCALCEISRRHIQLHCLERRQIDAVQSCISQCSSWAKASYEVNNANVVASRERVQIIVSLEGLRSTKDSFESCLDRPYTDSDTVVWRNRKRQIMIVKCGKMCLWESLVESMDALTAKITSQFDSRLAIRPRMTIHKSSTSGTWEGQRQ